MRFAPACILGLFATGAWAYQPLPASIPDELTITAKPFKWEDKIVITQYGVPADRPYRPIQMVMVVVRPEGHYAGKKSEGTPEYMARVLRERGALIGADAIINTRFEIANGYVMASGMAVRVNIGGEYGVPIDDPVVMRTPKLAAAPPEPGDIVCDNYGMPPR